MNPMREIEIDKVTLNIGVGERGTRLDRAKKIIERLSGRKAVITKSHKRTNFTTKDRPIGVKVTLRDKEAEQMLDRLVKSVEGVRAESFDDNGNFSFGISEYINIPDLEYDPKIGMYGLDVTVTLKRPGFRVKRRKIPSKVGENHLITSEQAMEFAKKLGINILEDKK